MFSFHDGPNTFRIRRRNCNADFADHTLGQAGVFRDLSPRVATVSRLENAASRTATLERPGLAIDFPETRIDNVWIGRIENQIDRARLVAATENLLPRLAAILQIGR